MGMRPTHPTRGSKCPSQVPPGQSPKRLLRSPTFTVPPCVAKDQEETAADGKSDFICQDSSCLVEAVPPCGRGVGTRWSLHGLVQPKRFHGSLARSRGLGGRGAQPRGAAPAAGGRGDVVGPVGSAGEGAGPQALVAQGAPHPGTAGTQKQRHQMGSVGLCTSHPQGALSAANYGEPPI